MTPGIVLDMEQGSQEWFQVRCGIVTASRCADVCAMKKDGDERAERRDYRAEIISEILTGRPYPQFVTREMQWGIDQEPNARLEYELRQGILVDTVGFVQHGEIDRFGCSPDGFVGDDGMVQFKCPTTATHLGWILGGVVPLEHMPQLLGELSCNPERQWIDFASFDPRMPEHLQLFVRRYYRDNKLIHALERNVRHFNAEVDQVLAALPQGGQAVVISIDQVNQDEMNF